MAGLYSAGRGELCRLDDHEFRLAVVLGDGSVVDLSGRRRVGQNGVVTVGGAHGMEKSVALHLLLVHQHLLLEGTHGLL